VYSRFSVTQDPVSRRWLSVTSFDRACSPGGCLEAHAKTVLCFAIEPREVGSDDPPILAPDDAWWLEVQQATGTAASPPTSRGVADLREGRSRCWGPHMFAIAIVAENALNLDASFYTGQTERDEVTVAARRL